MCQVLHVSKSGYYAWLKRPLSYRAQANIVLLSKIQALYESSGATYGVPRIHAQLRNEGMKVGRNRIAHLMRSAHLQGVSKRRAFTITTERNRQQRPAPDLVNRQFVANKMNQLWVADMTYLPTWSGFLYLAVVVDVYSRKVVGWAFGERMTADLVITALNMAIFMRQPTEVIHHSDQGSQYTSIAFGERCKTMGVRPSMGTVGDAYDNAMAESFFATLECELIAHHSWKNRTEARLAVFTWIEAWYNPRRLHSALNYLSPNEFERRTHASNHVDHETIEVITTPYSSGFIKSVDIGIDDSYQIHS